jgi:chromosome segregation ATPase
MSSQSVHNYAYYDVNEKNIIIEHIHHLQNYSNIYRCIVNENDAHIAIYFNNNIEELFDAFGGNNMNFIIDHWKKKECTLQLKNNIKVSFPMKYIDINNYYCSKNDEIITLKEEHQTQIDHYREKYKQKIIYHKNKYVEQKENYEHKISILNRQISKATTHNNNMKQSYSTCNGEEIDTEHYNKEQLNLKDDNYKLQHKLCELKLQLDGMLIDMQQLKTKNNELMDAHDKIKDELTSSTAKSKLTIQKMTTNYSTLQMKYDELYSKNKNTIQFANSHLSFKNTQLTSENEVLHDKIKSLNKTLKTHLKSGAKNNDDSKEQQHQLLVCEQNEKKLKSKDNTIKESQTLIENLKLQHEKNVDEIYNLKNNNNKLTIHADTLKNTITDLKACICTLKKKDENAHAQLVSENENLHAQIKSMNSSNSSSNSNLSAITMCSNCINYQQQIKENNENLQLKMDEIRKIKIMNDALKSNVSKYKKLYDEIVDENAKLEKQNKELIKNSCIYKETSNSLNNQHESNITTLHVEMDNYKLKHDNAIVEINKLQKLNNDLEQEINSNKTHMCNLNVQLSILQQKYKDTNAQLFEAFKKNYLLENRENETSKKRKTDE